MTLDDKTPDPDGDHLRSLTVAAPVSRRVLVTGLPIGFALAVQPVSAQTMITTDTAGLEAGAVTIPTPSGDVPAYRAMPAGAGPFPLVLVVQEIFGVHEHIRDVCRRFAKLGHMAVATELYARQGSVAGMSDPASIMRDVVSKVPDAQVMGDLDATVAWARATGKADVAKLGIVGFCWGGRIAWLYSAHNPGLKAAVAFYGQVTGEPSPIKPKNPIDIAADLKAPVLGLYGGQDQGIPVAAVERMRDACKAAGKTCEIVIYPEAGHAFHADYRPSYREGPAKDGWAKTQAWFKAHGAA